MGWQEFCRALFEHAQGQVFFQSLGNTFEDNERPRELISRNPKEIAPFIAKWDRAGRGMFVCVNTLKDGVHKRSKENVRQVTCLHADLDRKGLHPDHEGLEIKSMLLALPCPPSIIVHSGNGWHAYWIFHEPIDLIDAPDMADRIEDALRQLSDLVAGDPAVCEISRLMRLPGSHNTKRGGNAMVEILHLSDARYELTDVEDMLSILPPMLRRRELEQKSGEASREENPWLAAAQALGFKPPVDVESELSAMTLGGGQSGVHQTQLRVSASLLSRGEDPGSVVSILLEATRAAAGEYGRRWNWRKEEKNLRLMCETWLRKHPPAAVTEETPREETPREETPREETPTTATDDPPPAASQGARQAAKIIPIEQARTVAQAKKAPAAKDDKADPVEVVIDGVLKAVEASDERLMLTEGELYVYRAGLWRVADGADEQRLKVKIQEGFKAIGVKAKVGSLTQAWRGLTENPLIYRARVHWGSGRLICANGALTLSDAGAVLGFEPHSPDHYAQRKLGAPFDPDASCPRVIQHLLSLFDGRDDAADLVATLQEIAGMSIAPHLLGREGRKAFLGYGASRTGKTEFAELVRALVCGEGARVVSPSIKELSGEFGLQPLLGASAWIRDDAINEGDLIDPQKFKVIVTGEHVAVRRMRVLAVDVQFCMPVILTTNALPRVRDQTDALFNRCLVVPFDRVVSPDEVKAWKEANGCPASKRPIVHLFEQEAAGVLNWALEGLQRLLERGGAFDPPQAVLEVMQRFKDDNNPVQEFARLAVVKSPEHMVSRADLMCAMHGWQREMEGDEARAFGARAFFPRLRSAFPSVGDRTDSNGKRYVVGLKLTDEGLALWQTHNQGPQLRGGSVGSSIEKSAINRRINGGSVDYETDF